MKEDQMHDKGRAEISGAGLWIIVGAIVVVAVLAFGAVGGFGLLSPHRAAPPSGVRTANSPTLTYTYEWNSFRVYAHDFEFQVSGLTGPFYFGTQTVDLYSPNGTLLNNTRFYFSISDQDQATDNSAVSDCILEFTTSGTTGSYVYGNSSTCSVTNGGTLMEGFTGDVCNSATLCPPVTWNSGTGPTGTIVINGVATLTFPSTPWSTTTATDLDPFPCGYIPNFDP